MKQIITLYLSNGRTFRFHDVTDQIEGQNDKGDALLAFTYVSQSTGLTSKAAFVTDHESIIGYSSSDPA